MPRARDYSRASIGAGADADDVMAHFVDSTWDTLSSQGVTWIGFYFKVRDRDEMVLGHRRDKPACSPIGLHGVCGRGWRERRPIIVRDVKVLGADYVACDPRDVSEVVVPLFDPAPGPNHGACVGVLDADSFEPGAFSAHDAKELARLLIEAGLTTRASLAEPIVL